MSVSGSGLTGLAVASELDREIYETLSKILDGISRMNQSLLALMENFRQPVNTLPPPPIGDPHCRLCEGKGIMMYIGDDDLWKSEYCECRINNA